MKIKVKQIENEQWVDISIERLCSISIIDFLVSEHKPSIATIYNLETPIFFISNSKEILNKLGSKLPGFLANDFRFILNINPAISIELATVFQGSLLTSTEA